MGKEIPGHCEAQSNVSIFPELPGSLSDLGGRQEGKTGLSQILSSFKENSRSI